jgi:hypothetical protein
MGVIKSGILGGFSGKVGSVVGTSWKGISVMKALPESVANPRTAGQVAQRTKFSGVTRFGSELLTEIIKPLNDRFAQKMSGYNAFVKRNIAAFDADGVMNPTLIEMSKGSLENGGTINLTFDVVDGEFTLDWENLSGTGSAVGADKVYITYLNSSNGNTDTVSGTEIRSEVQNKKNNGKIQGDSGDVIYAFISFLAQDGSKVSTSQFASLEL